MAYAGVERHAALYIEGDPQGGGVVFHVKHWVLYIGRISRGVLQVWYMGSIYRVVFWYLRPRGLFWTGWYGGESVGYLKALFLSPESPGQAQPKPRSSLIQPIGV